MNNGYIDLIIRIKNSYMARRESLQSPHSLFKVEILKKLKQLGFVADYQVEHELKKVINIQLQYSNGQPALTDLKIFSKPVRRWYVTVHELKPVMSGMGYAILSTPKGVMTNIEAKKENLGGELLFTIW